MPRSAQVDSRSRSNYTTSTTTTSVNRNQLTYTTQRIPTRYRKSRCGISVFCARVLLLIGLIAMNSLSWWGLSAIFNSEDLSLQQGSVNLIILLILFVASISIIKLYVLLCEPSQRLVIRRQQPPRSREPKVKDQSPDEIENILKEKVTGPMTYRSYLDSHPHFDIALPLESQTDSARADDESCAVCLEPYDMDSYVSYLPCSDRHVFHSECIEAWYKTTKQTSCPFCKSDPSKPEGSTENQTEASGLSVQNINTISSSGISAESNRPEEDTEPTQDLRRQTNEGLQTSSPDPLHADLLQRIHGASSVASTRQNRDIVRERTADWNLVSPV